MAAMADPNSNTIDERIAQTAERLRHERAIEQAAAELIANDAPRNQGHHGAVGFRKLGAKIDRLARILENVAPPAAPTPVPVQVAPTPSAPVVIVQQPLSHDGYGKGYVGKGYGKGYDGKGYDSKGNGKGRWNSDWLDDPEHDGAEISVSSIFQFPDRTIWAHGTRVGKKLVTITIQVEDAPPDEEAAPEMDNPVARYPYRLPLDAWALIFEFGMHAREKRQPLYNLLRETNFRPVEDPQVHHLLGGGYPGVREMTPEAFKMINMFAKRRAMLEETCLKFYEIMHFIMVRMRDRTPMDMTLHMYWNLAERLAWTMREWLGMPRLRDGFVVMRPPPPEFRADKTPFPHWGYEGCKYTEKILRIPYPLNIPGYPRFRSGIQSLTHAIREKQGWMCYAEHTEAHGLLYRLVSRYDPGEGIEICLSGCVENSLPRNLWQY